MTFGPGLKMFRSLPSFLSELSKNVPKIHIDLLQDELHPGVVHHISEEKTLEMG